MAGGGGVVGGGGGGCGRREWVSGVAMGVGERGMSV